MQNTNLAHLFIDIDSFIFNSKCDAWRTQAAFQKCYLKLDPRLKMVTVCRWGFQKRPSRTESIYWVGLDLDQKKNSITGQIMASLEKWDKIWGSLHFSTSYSEAIPDLLPFSKAALPVASLENKLFIANMR